MMPGTHEDRKSSIDPAAIASLEELQEEGAPDFVADLIDSYLDEAPGRLSVIEAGIGSCDMIKVARACHILKGSSSNLGAERLSALCKDLEIKAATDQYKALPGACTKLIEEFANVRRELGNILARRPGHG
ncbi:MAG TPA: Hpt domain-containing protein [Fibrobacteria bacterium]|nr:Hpt domain-containing protein [Fibrobacteria bacterium]